MKKLAAFALALLMAHPAFAAKRVTVAQLDQTLVAASAAHRPDADIARQLGDLELTERLTNAALNQLATRFTPGPRTALALQMLADQSAFLDPPASEFPATAQPDAATQQRMMDAARSYVIQTVPHLVNFFVTRTTSHFEDTPQVLVAGEWPIRAGLHRVATTTLESTFRDGQESQQPLPPSTRQPQQETGLHSWGEFGPALAVVLTDTVKGKISFSHWEETPAGLAAVYSYRVPKSASHYVVNYCCLLDDPSVSRRMATGAALVTPDPLLVPPAENTSSHAFREMPGYHGSLAIDPASGAVLRITIEAELNGSDPLTRAATLIEYGSVSIGNQSFICPVRALALSTQDAPAHPQAAASPGDWGNALSHPASGPSLLLNETRFTDYHRLAATSRIVPGSGSATGQQNAEPEAPATAPDNKAPSPTPRP
jgi:hypothetical protein